MKRIAAPMIGGICTSFLLELLVYPAIYAAWRGWQLTREEKTAGNVADAEFDPRTGETVLRIP